MNIVNAVFPSAAGQFDIRTKSLWG